MKFSSALVPVSLLLPYSVGGTFYPADDEVFAYRGRWEYVTRGDEEPVVVARADWPCSGVQFSVTTATTSGASSSIALKLRLTNLHVNVVVANTTGAVESETILGLEKKTSFYEIDLPNKDAGTYNVFLTKLTQAAPLGNGVGSFFQSVLEFHGVELNTDVGGMTLGPSPLPSRRIAFIGASDTAGYCVDGTPDTSTPITDLWIYDNCEMASPGLLGRRLNAEIRVQAISGIGVTQNAFSHQPWKLGKTTMPKYYNRTLQTEKEPLWNFSEWRPDLVIVSLGGNDFNHQKEVPSNETFRAAYEEFLLEISEPYILEDDMDTPPPTIVSICGQGDPTEVERDPNNDRCRPCWNVEDATEAFRSKHGNSIQVEYIFIPCDGSVVTGQNDIGCDGHKDRLGQERVANFLEPQLREIMSWFNESGTDPIVLNSRPIEPIIVSDDDPPDGGIMAMPVGLFKRVSLYVVVILTSWW